MKNYLCLLLIVAGCAAHRPAPVAPVADVPVSLPPGVDSVVVTPHRTLVDKARAVVGLPPAAFTHVGKKATINIYYAPATIIGKKATAAVGDQAHVAVAGKHANQATDSATQQVATNAVAGHGNTASQTATVKPAPDWRSTLLKPLGYVLALAVVAGAGYFLWPLIVRRRTQV